MQQTALWRPALQAACLGLATFLALIALQPDVPADSRIRNTIYGLDAAIGLLIAFAVFVG